MAEKHGRPLQRAGKIAAEIILAGLAVLMITGFNEFMALKEKDLDSQARQVMTIHLHRCGYQGTVEQGKLVAENGHLKARLTCKHPHGFVYECELDLGRLEWGHLRWGKKK